MENIKNLETYIKNYDLNGTAYIEKNFTPFNDDQYQKISDYCNNVEKEFVKVGDADEPNHVNVGRFMTDIKKPEVVDNLYSNKLIEILWSENTKSYIKSIVNTKDEIYLRRVQYNQINKDCFVGYHLDVDSNPDYLAACVLQLGKKFNGGLYRVYHKDDKSSFIDYKPDYGSLIISDCQYPHEVTKVTDGERGSLVFFVSKNSDLNKRNK
tara:strand:+ start:812 stop:1441 length:630 start_codon:yes stop_codon:yes gene_type:complete